MDQFVLITYSFYHLQSTLPKNSKLEQKQEKEEIVPTDFDSIYCALNARLKTHNNKNLFDLTLSSPRIRLSHSENILVHDRDTKESLVDFVCALKQKNTDFPDIYFHFLGSNSKCTNKIVKAKDRGT